MNTRNIIQGWAVIRAAGLAAFAFLPLLLCAQNLTDALRYSNWAYGGTARFVGVGGAMGAIGADLSVASTNPAGLAWFQKSEFTVSGGIMNTATNSRLLNALNNPLSENQRGAFNIQNLGMVFTSQPRSAGKWKGANFAFTFNHLANFNREFYFEGITTGSITQRYQELANSGLGLNDYETDLANRASAIYDFDEDGRYDIDYEIPQQAPLLFKSQDGITRGSMSELSFALGANYDDKVLFGLSIGIPILSFTQDKTYTEKDDANLANGGAVPYFKDLSLREQVTTIGGGINAKFGVIVRPSQFLRIGASVHSPTAFTLSDDYESTLTYNYYEDAQERGQFLGKTASAPGNFEYGLNTPWRAMGGIGILFGKFGFIGAEAEFVDYSKARFRYEGFSDAERTVNSTIRGQLSDVVNLRLGGELAYEVFRLRAGVNRLPSPFLNDESARYVLSGGAGLRLNNFFLDMTYRHSKQDERYYPYLTDKAPIQEVLNEFVDGALILSLGFKF